MTDYLDRVGPHIPGTDFYDGRDGSIEADDPEEMIPPAEEYPDVTIRQNGPQVIGERCPWCGSLVLDADHSRSHD